MRPRPRGRVHRGFSLGQSHRAALHAPGAPHTRPPPLGSCLPPGTDSPCGAGSCARSDLPVVSRIQLTEGPGPAEMARFPHSYSRRDNAYHLAGVETPLVAPAVWSGECATLSTLARVFTGSPLEADVQRLLAKAEEALPPDRCAALHQLPSTTFPSLTVLQDLQSVLTEFRRRSGKRQRAEDRSESSFRALVSDPHHPRAWQRRSDC